MMMHCFYGGSLLLVDGRGYEEVRRTKTNVRKGAAAALCGAAAAAVVQVQVLVLLAACCGVCVCVCVWCPEK